VSRGTLRALALALLAGGCREGDEGASEVCLALVESWQGGPLPGYAPLTVPEIETILGQGVEQATAMGAEAVVAVVDREGFVLGVFAMAAAPLGPAFPVPATLPPDGAPGINAAIAKARTAAFLSSNQNAFSTRTAAFIVDSHFPPGVSYQPGGPLFGVQNSNDTGGDVVRGVGPGGVPNSNNPTPLPNPNGFSGAPGGFPLYKDGRLVGGVGASGDTPSADESIAVAAARGFMAPHPIRACEIFVEGFRLAFAEARGPFVTATLPFGALPGAVVLPVVAGGPQPPLPVVSLDGVSGQLVFPIFSSPLLPPTLTDVDVSNILTNAAFELTRLRAAIRLPLGSRAQVTIAVVDVAGMVLGAFRPADCTRFSLDLAVQKARTAVVYSDGVSTPALGEPIAGVPPGTAMSTRAVGFMAQPFYPPGIDGTAAGPLFGVQDALPGGLGAGIPGLDLTPGSLVDATNGNGITIFPGGIPLYKGGVLVGAVGVSGDGVDQDDLVAAAGAAGFEPPAAIRCDAFFVRGVRLPWVKFPRNPYEGVK
jgi:uncharacterized protein GlcG (DUF336 family)